MRAAIALVEDDELVRLTIEQMIEALGHACVSFPSAEALLAEFDGRDPPAALVTDVNLGPGMSGLDLGAHVRRLWPGIPIIYATGWHPALARHDLGEGEFLLQKPFPTSALDRVLRQGVQHRV
ncbi:MAG TPA: response regulator [Acidisphaera sp.]|nr:response regulator [Acidisphaera sp.]